MVGERSFVLTPEMAASQARAVGPMLLYRARLFESALLSLEQQNPQAAVHFQRMVGGVTQHIEAFDPQVVSLVVACGLHGGFFRATELAGTISPTRVGAET